MGILKPLSQIHANRPHILTYWNLCAGGVGEGWAGRVALRTGCPDSIPAICLWPLALVKNCQFPPLGLLSHFWSKKEKKIILAVFCQTKASVLFQMITFRVKCISFLNRYSLWTISGRWQHCPGKFLPETERVFHISLFIDQKGQGPLNFCHLYLWYQ